MTAPFPSDPESLAAERAAARAAAATAAAAASAAASAAAAAVVHGTPDHTLEDNDRLEIVNTKPNVMDDPMVGVDDDSVVAATGDPHVQHSDVDARKPEDAHDVGDSDGVAVANGEADSDTGPLHVVVQTHDPSVDDRRDPSDERVVDPVPDISVSVAPHHHHSALTEPQSSLDAHVDEVVLAADAAQETEPHSHIAELLPAPTATPLPPPPPVILPLQQPVKKKRKTYSTEEERRKARILKNRRTAEESRQRRMKRMKELEEYAARASVREKELQEETRMVKEQLQDVTESLRSIVEEKNAEIAQKDAEIQRLHDKLAMK